MSPNNKRVVKNSPCTIGRLFYNIKRAQALKPNINTNNISEKELLILKVNIVEEKQRKEKHHERKKF